MSNGSLISFRTYTAWSNLFLWLVIKPGNQVLFETYGNLIELHVLVQYENARRGRSREATDDQEQRDAGDNNGELEASRLEAVG